MSQAIYNADGTVAASVQYMTPMNGISGTTTAEDIAGTLVTTPLTVDVTKDHVVFNGYDAVGRQTSSVNNLGEVSEIVYNADGSVAQTIGYGTRPSSITDVITGSALTASELATMSATVGTKVAALPVPNLANNDHLTFNLYDAAGRQTYTINGLGSVSQAIYNADGTVAASVQYMTPMNGISGTTTAEDIAGTLVTIPLTVDMTRDHVSFNVYDAAGRLTRSANGLGEQVRRAYNADGTVAYSVQLVDRISGLNNMTGQTLSSQDFATLTTDMMIAMKTGSLLLDMTRDKVVFNVYDAAGRQTFSINGLGEVSQNIYNADSTLAASVQYASRPSSITDTANMGSTSISASGLRALGNALSTAAASLTVDLTKDHVVFNGYDAVGRQTSSVNNLGEVSEIVYNADGSVAQTIGYGTRPSSITDVITGSALTASELATMSATVGTKVAALPVPNLANNDHLTFNLYDAAGRQTYTINGLGSVSQAIYNADGTVAASVQYMTPMNGISGTTTAEDIAGTLVTTPLTVDVTKDHVVFNGYDAVGRQTSSVNNLGEVSEIVYNADGSVAQTIGYGTRPSSITDVITGSALTASELATMSATVGTKVAALPVPNLANNDHLTFNLYDAAGRQTYTINGLG
ncbi:hypothetical protein B0B52_00800, partial [Polaromonas sp. A23]